MPPPLIILSKVCQKKILLIFPIIIWGRVLLFWKTNRINALCKALKSTTLSIQ
jgi:hypothetical protein